MLAPYFGRIEATDISPEQIGQAFAAQHVRYSAQAAEATDFASESFNLVTVAQALHWFDVGAFYAEVSRVLVPGGAIAVWTYGDAVLADAALDARFQRYTHAVLGAYWPPERRLVGPGYRDIPFPFAEVAAPAFRMERACTLAEVTGYVGTWSATTRFVRATGRDSVEELARALAPHWGDADRRVVVRWPLTVRAGRATQTHSFLDAA